MNFTDEQNKKFIEKAAELQKELDKARIVNGALLDEILVTLKHARTFIITRQKMHEVGVELYDEAISRLEDVIEHGQKPNLF